jgi:hypothetical protein
VYEGPLAIRGLIGGWWGAFEDFRLTPEEFRDLGNGVAFAVLRYDGRPLELLIPASVGAEYLGSEGIRRFFTDIEDAGPDFRIEVQRVQAIGDSNALALLRVGSTGRASGIVTGAESANVYDFIDGKIRLVRVVFDRKEALEAVGLRE